MKTCKTCKRWTKIHIASSERFVCNSPHIHDVSKCSVVELAPGEASCSDYDGFGAYFMPGPDFGCIHHEVNEDMT